MLHGRGLSRRNWLVPVLAVATVGMAGLAKQPASTHCDSFGPYTVNPLDPSTASKVQAGLRSFIWIHWHGRRRGYAIVTESSPVEFSSCTNKYFIEPDKKNNWRVIVQSQCKTRPRKGRFSFVSVQRFAKDSAGHPVGAALPGAADIPPAAYALVLRDKTGRVRWEL